MPRGKGRSLRKDRARAGFGIAPILYMLGLIGVGAGVLFSSYSQSIKNNINMTNGVAVKNDLDSAATTLAATSVMSADGTLLCPPQGGGAEGSCATAFTDANPAIPNKLADFYAGGSATTGVVATDPHLPTGYASAYASGAPVEVGVFTSGSGTKQLDPWGHYYIVCRWENSPNNTATPAFQIISAGPSGVLDTACGSNPPTPDNTHPVNYSTSMNAANAINRSSVWQVGAEVGTTTLKASYGAEGLSVDSQGNLVIPGTGSITLGTSITAPNGLFSVSSSGALSAISAAITDGLTAGSGAFVGALSAASGALTGALSAESLAFQVGSGGALSAGNGGFTVAPNLAAGAFAVLAGGAFNAAGSAFGVDSTGSLTISAGGTPVFTVASASGNTSISGTLAATGTTTLGSSTTTPSLITYGEVNIGTTVQASTNPLPYLSVGTSLGGTPPVYPFYVTQAGAVVASAVTAGAFNGTLNGNVNGGTVAASSITDSGALSAGATTINGSEQVNGNLTVTGTISGAGSIGLGTGGPVTGILPIVNGGTSASTAAAAIANLTSGVTNTIPGAALVNNSVTSAQLNVINPDTGGPYNEVFLDASGRVTSAQWVAASPGITDGTGDSVDVGGGDVTVTINSAIQGFWNSTGLMIGTSMPPKNKLDVYGATAIGVGYAGVDTAPANGLIVVGSVGIGTSTPVSALQVVGTITATSFVGSVGAGSITGTLGTGNGGTGNAGPFTPGSVIFVDGSGDLNQDNGQFFWNDTTHRLGIGTTTPGSPLHIVSTALTGNSDIQIMGDQWGGSGTGPSMRFDNLNGDGSLGETMARIHALDRSFYSGALVFETNPGSGSGGTSTVERMRIDNSGNVGIGTATPANALDVNGSLAVGTFAGTVSGASNELIVGGNVGIGATAPLVSLDMSQRADALALPGNTTGAAGRPASLINGEIRYNSAVPAIEAYVNNAWVTLLSTGGGGGGVTGTGILNYVAKWTPDGMTLGNSQIFDNGTNVGIGTNTPTYLLSLSGAAAQTFWMERSAAASDVAGNNLTVQAGGASLGSSNLAGGNLILASGISTGNGTSSIQFNTYPAASSGTSDNLALAAATLSATGTLAAGNVSTILQGASIAAGSSNLNGGNLTLASGISTGTGTSNINFNVYPGTAAATAQNSPTTAMTILGNGNVGIGTTAPGVVDGIDESALGRTFNVTSATSFSQIVASGVGIAGFVSVDSAAPTDEKVWAMLGGSGNFGVNSYTDAGVPTNRFLINSVGNVGIGSTSPVAQLDVEAGTSTWDIYGNNGNASGVGVYGNASGGAGSFGGYYTNASGGFGLGVATGGIFIGSSTTGPTAYGLYNNAGTLYWNGFPIASAGGGWGGATITVPEGGTGDTTLTQYGVLIGEGVNPVQATPAGATGTVFEGVTGSTPVFSANLLYNGTESNPFGADYTTVGTTQAGVNLGTSSSVRYAGLGASTFYGIAAPTSAGQVIRLHNASNFTLTLSNLSPSDASANQIITGTGADLAIPKNTSVTLQYDPTAAHWRVTGSSNAAVVAWPLLGPADTATAPDYSWAAQSGTGLYYNSGIGFTVGGTAAGAWTSTGLGIGTGAPAATLAVNGGAIIGALSNDFVAANSLAVGYNENVTTGGSLAVGNGNFTAYSLAVAMGNGNVSTGQTSMAFGTYADAFGDYSLALGNRVIVGTAWGQGNGFGNYSMGIGLGTAAGTAPTITGTSSMGIFMGDRSGDVISSNDVMAIMGGNVGIGTTSPNAALDVGNASGSALRVVPTANEVDYLQISGGVAASSMATLSAQGTDSNINIGLTPKGSGSAIVQSIGAYTGFILSNGGTVASLTGSSGGNDNGTLSLLNGGANKVVLLANGSSYFNGGNVGIGTATPAGTLDVEGGNAAAGGGSSINLVAQNAYSSGSGPGGNINLTAGSGFGGWGPGVVRVSNVSQFFVGRDGFDGYTPTSVSNQNPNPNTVMSNGLAGDGDTALDLSVVRNAAGNAQQAYWGGVAVTGAGNYSPAIVFGQSTGTNSYAERMRIDTTGNVGVGTTSPSSTLEVYTTAEGAPSNNTTQFRIHANASNVINMGLLSGPPYGGYIQVGGGSVYPLLLNPNGGGVGIGSASPVAQLDVEASSTWGIYGNNGNASGVGIYGNASGGAGSYGGYYTNASGGFGLGVATGGIYIGSSTAGPTAYGLYNNAGTLYWNGTALAAAGASGTVNTALQYQMAYYAANGTTVSGDANITTDAANDLLIPSGKVGIGTATPTMPLDIVTTMTNATGAVNYAASSTYGAFTALSGASANISAVPSAEILYPTIISGMTGSIDLPVTNANTVDSSYGVVGSVSNESTAANNLSNAGSYGMWAQATNTGNIDFMTGAGGYAETDSGTANYLIGGDFSSDIEGGTSNIMTGVYGAVYVDAGTVSSVYGLEADPGIWGGSITGDMIGVYVSPNILGGTVANRYGVYIDDGGGAATADDFGLYQVAAYQKNYFAGKVGIGTTAPAYPLDVAAPYPWVVGINTSGGVNADHYLAAYNQPAYAFAGATGSGMGSDGSSLVFDIGSAEKMRITPSGNVGIGTTAPAALLDVYAAAGVGVIDIGGVNGISIPASDTNSIAIGPLALASQVSGAFGNTAVGYTAMTNTTTAWENAAFGYQALYSNQTGNANSGFGDWTIRNNTTGAGNTAVGVSALYTNVTGSGNVAIGSSAQWSFGSDSGSFNIAIGEDAFGYDSHGISGSENISIGDSSGLVVSSGANNTTLGSFAMQALTTGSNNTIIGYEVADTELVSGNNNILIGTDDSTDTVAGGTNNSLNIGNAIYGLNLINNTNAGGVPLIGIGTAAPVNTLDVTGTGIHISSSAAPSSATYNLYNVGGTLYWNGTPLSAAGASGTVNTGTQYQMAYYAANGTTVSGDANITTDAANDLLIPAGKVGIGTASPAMPIDIVATMTNATGAVTYTPPSSVSPLANLSGMSANLSVVPGAEILYTDGGIVGVTGAVDVPVTNANTVGATSGVTGAVSNESTAANNLTDYAWVGAVSGQATNTGNLNYMAAVSGWSESDSGQVNGISGADFESDIETGASTNMVGVDAGAFVDGGTVGSVYGVEAAPEIYGGSVTDMYGLYVYPGISGGAVANRYGVYIDDGGGLATADDFGLYQVAAYQKNYFAGNVGIGTTGPAAKLDVYGAIDVNGANGISWPDNDSSSLAVGPGTLAAQTAINLYNTAVGWWALNRNTTGSYNAALGAGALAGNHTGFGNSAFGYNAGGNVDSSENTVFGYMAGGYYYWGGGNAAFGSLAGFGFGNAAANNLAMGTHVGSALTGKTGSNNILIGTTQYTDTQSTSSSNTLNIGNLIYGTGLGTTSTAPAGSVGIGTTTPAGALDVESVNPIILGGTSSTGYVGIGTTTPVAQLDVEASSTWGIYGNNGNASGVGIYGNASGGAGSYGGYYTNASGGYGLGVATGGIYIGSSTAGPTAYGLYNNAGTLYWNGTALATAGSMATGSLYQMAFFSAANTVSGDANITTDASNDLLIPSGKVGIGTTSPGGPLEIDTGAVATTTAIIKQTNSASGNYFANMEFHNTTSASPLANFSLLGAGYPAGNLWQANDFVLLGGQGNASTNMIFITNTSGAVKFGTGGYATTNERMRIGANGGISIGNSYVSTDPGSGNEIISGKVGIGTTSPGYTLHVMDSAAAGSVMFTPNAWSSGSNGERIYLGDTSTYIENNWGGSFNVKANAPVNIISGSGSSVTLSPNGGYPVLTAVNSGVGIGTTSPGATLDVESNTASPQVIIGGPGGNNATLALYPSTGMQPEIFFANSHNQFYMNSHLSGYFLTLDTGVGIYPYNGSGLLNLSWDFYGNQATSGDSNLLLLGTNAGFVPSSGNGTYEAINDNSIIAQTGSANGITRGLYINPQITNTYDYRGIETAAYTDTLLGTPPTTLRQVLFNAPTLAAGGSTTVTNAATQIITGAPIAGSNVSITNSYGLMVLGTTSVASGTTNAYGASISAPTGATNNYAAVFSGSVGIGTTVPQQNLSIQNGLNIDQANTNAQSVGNALTFGGGSGEGIGSRRTSGGNQYGLDFYTGFIERMTITGGGNVGIGSATPQATLDVNGFAKLKLNASAPATCNAAAQGSFALTHTARSCICDATNTWSDTVTGSACSW